MAPQLHFEAQRQQTTEFKKACQLRAGVEGTISQAAYILSARQSRCRGTAKTHLQNLATAVAANLFRVIAWLNNEPRSATAKSHSALLAG